MKEAKLRTRLVEGRFERLTRDHLDHRMSMHRGDNVNINFESDILEMDEASLDYQDGLRRCGDWSGLRSAGTCCQLAVAVVSHTWFLVF